MSEKKNSTALVPTKKPNSLPVPVKKGELRTPFSLMILSTIGIVFVSNVGIDYAVYGQR